MAHNEKEKLSSPSKSGTISGFRDAFKKAVTELLILRLLQDADMYAYEMQREIERKSTGVLSFNTLYLVQHYPNGYHITCTVSEGKGETIVRWTGSGTTDEGIEEDVNEQYVCPYHFRVRETDELSGQAAERARYAEEENRRTIEAMG